MLDSSGKLNINTLNDYQNDILSGYIKKVEYYSLGNLKTLPIRYLREKPSNNQDHETGLKHSQINSVYWEYHFLPTVESQMLSPQVMYDDMKQGLNYTATGDLVIMSVDSPKPGDLFNFYVDAHKVIPEKELFKILDVNFLRTALGLNLYRITYETANLKIDAPYIEKTFFYNNEFRKVYSGEYLLHYRDLIKRDYIDVIKKYYKESWSIVYDTNLTTEQNAKLNKVLLWVKSQSLTNSTNLPLIVLTGYDPSKIVNPFYTGEDGLSFSKEDVWFTDPEYIEPHLRPDFDINNPPEWKWLNGKIPNELALTIYKLLYLYYPFIFDLGKQESKLDYLEKTNLLNEFYRRKELNQNEYRDLNTKFSGTNVTPEEHIQKTEAKYDKDGFNI